MSQTKASYTTRKYHDPLDDALDRPIAFNPAFKRITGSTVAALMLSQAWYWSKRTSDNDGWFYKTIEEWEEETGLTRSEQETARKHLKQFMEVDLRGIPATLYYRLNKEEIYNSLGVQFATFPQTSLPEPSVLVSDIPANINRNTENTAETTPTASEMQSITTKANKQVDGMLEADRVASGKLTYPKRDSLPDPIRELIDAFVSASGIKPMGKEAMGWMSAAQDWLNLHVTAKDVTETIEYAKGKFTVSTPHSLTNTLRARKASPDNSQPVRKANHL